MVGRWNGDVNVRLDEGVANMGVAAASMGFWGEDGGGVLRFEGVWQTSPVDLRFLDGFEIVCDSAFPDSRSRILLYSLYLAAMVASALISSRPALRPA